MHSLTRKIAVIGGSGFLGTHLVPALTRAGHEVHILSRQAKHKIGWRNYTQTPVHTVDPVDLDALKKTLSDIGADTLYNLVGILNETRHNTFKSAHEEIVGNIVSCGQALHIHRVIHISALRADSRSGSSRYLRSRGEGDSYLRTYFPDSQAVTIFRPSVIFGRRDRFVYRFARIFKALPRIPFLPIPIILPRTNTLLAPVYVEDLVGMLVDALDDPSAGGKCYDVCGPETLSLGEIIKKICQSIGVRSKIINLPDWLGRIQCAALEILPGKLMTVDQFNSLEKDNISTDARIGSTPLTRILPVIVADLDCRDPYAKYRKTARRK